MSRTVVLSATVVLALVAACTAALVAALVKPAEAAFPGRNGDIAFAGNLDGDQTVAIFVMGPDGSNLRKVDFPRIYNNSPAFSPDGTKLAAGNNAEEEWSGEILLANADGSQRVNLTKSPDFNESNPAWFPSGRRLVYCRAPIYEGNIFLEEYELYALSFNKAGNAVGSPKRLTNNNVYDCSPAVSPDGKTIAFERYTPRADGQDSEIYVMRVAGFGAPGPNNRPVKLTNNSVADGAPDWSPDGRKIVYESNRSVWIMNPDGSGKKRLGGGRTPAFSPDGRWIVFANAGVEGIPGTSNEIWKMRTDGTGRTKLTSDDGYAGFPWFTVSSPDWQPLP